VPPIGRQASAALSPIILLGLPLPPGAETDGLGADLPPRS
jgi:hypothetical protein